MLTEIEWWGGLIILWAIGVYRYLSQTDELHEEPETDLGYYLFNTILLLSIATVSLYFYSLDSAISLLVYQVLLGLLILISLALLVWDRIDTFRPDEEGSSDTDIEKNENSDSIESGGDDDPEDVGVIYTVIGHVFLYTPTYVAIALGATKIYPLV